MSGPYWTTKLFNRISSKHSGWRDNLQATANMDTSSSSFYRDELSRALSEQSFGLTRYEVARQSSEHEATAIVTLLEGTNLSVRLNIRGYQLSDGGQTHESIEELLQSISLMYARKREELIMSKLHSLQ